MHRALGLHAIPAYLPILSAETHFFLCQLVATPANYVNHIRRYAGGLTLSVVYGYEAAPYQDEFLALAEESIKLLSEKIASGGGIWPVDVFPSLQYLPTWFPGAGFKTKAMKWKAKLEECVERPFEYVKNSIVSHAVFAHSFISMMGRTTESWHVQTVLLLDAAGR
jgi:hypothetical protein